MSESGLADAYRRYDDERAASRRWSLDNAGNRAIHAERNRAFAAALRARPIGRLVEVGSGDGSLLDELVGMAPAAACVGIEVLSFRVAAAVARGVGTPFVEADGCRLPFPNGCVDAVVLSTVVSSIRDDEIAARLATEASRVLRPGGAVLWYDMRLPNPANRSVRPIGRARLRALFPDLVVNARSLTVVPQVARRLGRHARVYRVLAAVPALRSHLFAVLEKPEGPRG